MLKSTFALIIFSLLGISVTAQQRDLGHIADSIKTEGKALYQSELASWYGTDVFLEKCKAKVNRLGGYFSYTEDKGITNVLFTKGDSPKILATIRFSDEPSAGNYQLDTAERNLSSVEQQYYAIRQTAFKATLTDSLFKHYQNTDLNLIPIINNGIKKVYILTGPKVNGTVIIGNDYLLNFDNRNRFTSTKKLHKNPLFFRQTPGQKAEAAVHSHLPSTGDFITATDICTLMLYGQSAGWNFHVVISNDYVSSWDCKNNQLVILTRKAWDKINASK